MSSQFDERGFPVWMAVIDPRAFALHKAWISVRIPDW
jgi:Nucleotidyltransferase